MSTLQAANIQTLATATLPVIKDSAGTEYGRFCRAFISYNGYTGPTINSSFNVTSVTKNGTGDYTINFTNAFSDTNYVVSLGGQRGDGSGFINFGQSCIQGTANNTPSFTTSQIRLNTANSNGTAAVDWPVVFATIFR